MSDVRINDIDVMEKCARKNTSQATREEALRGMKWYGVGNDMSLMHMMREEFQAGDSITDTAMHDEFKSLLGGTHARARTSCRISAAGHDTKIEPSHLSAMLNGHGIADASSTRPARNNGMLMHGLGGLMQAIGDIFFSRRDKSTTNQHSSKNCKQDVSDAAGANRAKQSDSHQSKLAAANVTPVHAIPESVKSSSDPHSALSGSAPSSIIRYKAAIEDASCKTGLEANLIAAMIWAESRGNPNAKSSNPEDHLPDVGLMQISQHTYDAYVRAKNKSLPALNVRDPAQNILAGAYEMSQHLRDKGGNLKAGLTAYVGEGINSRYAGDVLGFYNNLTAGKALRD